MKWLFAVDECPGLLERKRSSELQVQSQAHVTYHLKVKIPNRWALVNITAVIEDCVRDAGIEDGMCLISSLHITSGIYINDAESGLLNDLAQWLEKLAPFGLNYQHHQTGEDNADAHLKTLLTNHQVIVPVSLGELELGTWQQVFYAEFDGQREKRILVKVMGLKV